MYNQDDKILILNNTNFQANICSSTRAWLVEFYSSWCGHCIHFAPTYKEFAADVFGEIYLNNILENILITDCRLEGGDICWGHRLRSRGEYAHMQGVRGDGVSHSQVFYPQHTHRGHGDREAF